VNVVARTLEPLAELDKATVRIVAQYAAEEARRAKLGIRARRRKDG
jgi:hypothetical protein